MRLTILRHGQTIENVKKICQGQLPGHLTVQGKKQAQHTAKRLIGQQFDRIFSSDLKRAKDTTKELLKYHKVPVQYTRELRELNKGIFEGKPAGVFDKARKNARKALWEFRPKGGDSWSDGYTRAKKFYDHLLKKYPDKKLVIVSHSTFIGLLLAAILGWPVKKALPFERHQTHECISVVTVDKKGRGTLRTTHCGKHVEQLVC